MTIERRVLWVEGAFLRPQHFQQNDRHHKSVIAQRAAMAQPYHWGFSDLKIDEAEGKRGRVAIKSCTGAFRSGECFSYPDDVYGTLSVEISAGSTNVTVYLVTPIISADKIVASVPKPDGSVGTRYVIQKHAIADSLYPESDPPPVETALCNARLVIGTEDTEGYETLAVARVLSVANDGALVFDDDFVPPVTSLRASGSLHDSISAIASNVSARADQLSGQGTSLGVGSDTAVMNLMRLQVLNAKGAVFSEFREVRLHHPELLFRETMELVASLCALSPRQEHRAHGFPHYDHDNIRDCFRPVLDILFRVLGETDDPDAYVIPLKRSTSGVFFGDIKPESLLPKGRFIVVARADNMAENLFRTALVKQTKIASKDEIRSYITSADLGVALEPLGAAPGELKFRDGWTYFELKKGSAAWASVASSKDIALFAARAFENLELELWGIRSRE